MPSVMGPKIWLHVLLLLSLALPWAHAWHKPSRPVKSTHRPRKSPTSKTPKTSFVRGIVRSVRGGAARIQNLTTTTCEQQQIALVVSTSIGSLRWQRLLPILAGTGLAVTVLQTAMASWQHDSSYSSSSSTSKMKMIHRALQRTCQVTRYGVAGCTLGQILQVMLFQLGHHPSIGTNIGSHRIYLGCLVSVILHPQLKGSRILEPLVFVYLFGWLVDASIFG